MTPFEESIQSIYDARLSTLGKVKLRSLGADMLSITALRVLVYAQLEGGVKDLVSCLIKHINRYKLLIGETSPNLLHWRNQRDLDAFRSAVNFEGIASPSPFSHLLKRRVTIRPINRKFEMNQMDSSALREVFSGLGLDLSQLDQSSVQIDQLVDGRNIAAHHGSLPTSTVVLAENQLRDEIAVVGTVLTDVSIQLLGFFAKQMHRR